jgi:ribosome-binding protein aMBF1 (putative translation factor)
MSVYDMWTICDRCSFKYRRKYMKKERSGVVVCESCYDGAFDALRHPQNRSARPRHEMRQIPEGRASEVTD